MKIRNTTKANILYAMLVATMIGSSVLLSFIMALAGGENANPVLTGLLEEVSWIFPQLLMMVPALIYICVLKAETVDDIKYGMVGARQLLLIFCVTVLIIPITTVINYVTSIGVPSTGDAMAADFMQMPVWKSVLYIALVPAVCEEVLFRGLIYHGFRRRNKFIAIIISSVMFGLLHMNINQFAYATVMGIIFALVVEITGSLLSSVIIHFLFNAYNVAMAYLMVYMEESFNMDTVVETTTNSHLAIVVTQYIYEVIYLVGMAVVAVCLLILVLRGLIKVSGAGERMKAIFSKEGRKTYHEEGRTVDIFFILALIPIILFMIIYEISIRIG